MSNDLNEETFRKLNLHSQEITILKSLRNFYAIPENYKLLISIINGENKLSRRLIEYFVTTYSKQNKCIYNISNSKFDVYISYKTQLKSFKKHYFDPFGRGLRIPYFFEDDCIITTTGQLNFYRWFISKNIYQFILKNYSNIENNLCSLKKNKISNNKKQKFRKIDTSVPKSYSKPKLPESIIVTFD